MTFLIDLLNLSIIQLPISGIIMLSFNCIEEWSRKTTYLFKRSICGIIIWTFFLLFLIWKAPGADWWFHLTSREMCFEIARMIIPLLTALFASVFISTQASNADRKAAYDVFCSYKEELNNLAVALDFALNHKSLLDVEDIDQKITALREKSGGRFERTLNELHDAISGEKVNWEIVEMVSYLLSNFYF